MMEVRDLELSETARGLLYVARMKVLLQQEIDLLDEVLDWPYTAPDAPHVIETDQTFDEGSFLLAVHFSDHDCNVPENCTGLR